MLFPSFVVRVISSLGVLAFFAIGTVPAGAEDWPAWRGANGDGISAEGNILTEWDDKQNVRWRVELPEPGNSTPVVWKDRIFVTQTIAEKKLRTLMCFDRKDGQVLWTAEVSYDEKEKSHKTNPYCSASPVTDGQRVFAWFGSAGLYCYDMTGTELWHRELGEQNHMWGYAASPLLYEDLCIVNFGPGVREFLIAVNKTNGADVWQVDAFDDAAESKLATPAAAGDAKTVAYSDGDEPVDRSDIQRGSWSTPLIVKTPQRDELIISHPHRIAAYDPETGHQLWYGRGLGPLVYSSPIAGDGAIVGMSGYLGGSLAVRPGGSGDVTDARRLWHTERSPVRLGCGVIKDGDLYVTDMKGIAQCVGLKSREVRWEERLAGSGGNNATWASMVLCEDRLYLLNQSGDTFVFRAAPEFELLATNSLGETTNSSIVISDGNVFIRTHKALWCFGE